ncbi:hypothetical protein JCM8547_001603 [Rhodosporidiobolus lusitaniae]
MALRRRLSLNRHPSTAPRLPEFLKKSSVWARVSAAAANHLNFYRIHLLFFIFIPLIWSGIFYASNGPSERNQIPYVDALFMTVSAMTVTGLNSVLLARLTLWQTVIIFFMMTIGSTSFVSIIVIVIRRQFFRNKFEYMLEHDDAARKRVNEIGAQEAALQGRAYRPFDDDHRSHVPWFAHLLPPSHSNSGPSTPRPSPANSAVPTRVDDFEDLLRDREKQMKKKRKKLGPLRADMIKRVDVPVRVNEMSVSGRLGDERREQEKREKEEREREREKKRRLSGSGEEDEGEDADGEREDEEDDEEEEENGLRKSEPFPFTAPPKKAELPQVFTDDEGEEAPAAPAMREPAEPRHHGQFSDSPQMATPETHESERHRAIHIDEPNKPIRTIKNRRSSDSAASSPHRNPGSFPRVRTMDHRLDQINESPRTMTPVSPTFPRNHLDMGRTRTIEFRDPTSSEYPDLRLRRNRTLAIDPDFPTPRRISHANLRGGEPSGLGMGMGSMNARTLTRTQTYGQQVEQSAMHTGFGGFPNPIVAAASLAKSKIPALRNAVDRNMTMQRTTTIMSTHSHPGTRGGGSLKDDAQSGVKPVSYISFDAVVGRNSKFHGLTSAQQDELGGVEYRALTLLLRIVVAYWLFCQLIAVLCLAPWLTYSKKYQPVFDGPDIEVNPTWFVFFQVWSSFSNNGMSLSDSSMIPFQQAYWLIIVQSLLILGGNTAFPIFLRLAIWITSKIVPRQSRTRETLQFLLDHPRRCFIYLFPSHQTWFLVFTLICLNGIDWACFLVLDIGNPVIEAIPTGVRVIDGLFQAFAVRAAGFSIVPLASVAPALQLLYVIMMYIAVYPIAVSIRATNVYEEKSMGVYDEDFDEDPDDVEARFDKSHSATQYIGYHARKQLAFDLWWLALAVWLICIVERHRIGSDEWPEVTIFTLIFEIVSAYGTVGLSLGNNRNNTSLSGVLSTLSKLIVIAVMIRGRHRGLPIAIDRAVLLPSDLEKHGDDTATAVSVDHPNNEFGLRSRATRGGSMSSHPGVVDAGGLDAVEPLTDEARADRIRQASQMSSVGEGPSLPGSGAATPAAVLDDRDVVESSREPTESSSSGSGKKTAEEEVEMQELEKANVGRQEQGEVGEEKQQPPTDRNQVGWR